MDTFEAQDDILNHTLSTWNATTGKGGMVERTEEAMFPFRFGEVEGLQRPERPLAPPSIINFTNTMILAFTYPVALSATILNVSLLIALYRVKQNDLKAKPLVQNNALVNILFPVCVSLDTHYIGQLIGGLQPNVIQCLNGLYLRLNHSLIMVQSICVFSLALDRLFATVSPLRYHTGGYNRVIKVAMLAFPWLVAVLVAIIMLFLVDTEKETERLVNGYFACTLLEASSYMEIISGLLYGYIMTIDSVSVLIYISIFIHIKYMSLKIKSLNNTQMNSRSSLSLSITYFCMNLTTLSLYTPLPLSSLAAHVNSSDRPELAMMSLLRGLHLVYTLNSCVDPLILMKRIPVIRKNLPFSKQMELRSEAVDKPTNLTR